MRHDALVATTLTIDVGGGVYVVVEVVFGPKPKQLHPDESSDAANAERAGSLVFRTSISPRRMGSEAGQPSVLIVVIVVVDIVTVLDGVSVVYSKLNVSLTVPGPAQSRSE